MVSLPSEKRQWSYLHSSYPGRWRWHSWVHKTKPVPRRKNAREHWSVPPPSIQGTDWASKSTAWSGWPSVLRHHESLESSEKYKLTLWSKLEPQHFSLPWIKHQTHMKAEHHGKVKIWENMWKKKNQWLNTYIFRLHCCSHLAEQDLFVVGDHIFFTLEGNS